MAIILYLIYLFSGIIKAVFIFYGLKLPVDLTLLSGVLLLVYLVYDIYINGIKTKFNKDYFISLLILSIFFVWIGVSLLYSVSEGYAYRKVILFVTNIIAFIYPLFVKNFNLHKFLKYFAVSLIIAFLWFFYIYFILIGKLKDSDLYLKITGLSLTLAVYGGIILLVLISTKQKIFKKNIYNIGISLLFFVFLLLSGARGPIFFLIISLLLFLGKKVVNLKIPLNVNKNKLLKTLFFTMPLLIIFVFTGIYQFYDKISLLLERSVYRISLIINGIGENTNMGESVNVRINQMGFAIKSIFNNLQNFFIGYGFGSFGIMYSGEDGRLYPHNILLEIWFELGFIGLLIFCVFLFFIFFGKIKQRLFVTGFVMLYIFLNMLKSSSVVDIRVFFAFFAIFIIKENLIISKIKKIK